MQNSGFEKGFYSYTSHLVSLALIHKAKPVCVLAGLDNATAKNRGLKEGIQTHRYAGKSHLYVPLQAY